MKGMESMEGMKGMKGMEGTKSMEGTKGMEGMSLWYFRVVVMTILSKCLPCIVLF